MKKLQWLIFLALLIPMFSTAISFGAELRVGRIEARQVMVRTAAVISTAKRFAVQGHKYAGMGLAVGHQRLARDFFRNGLYVEAVFHSLRARVLAAKVMKQNQSEVLNEALYDRMEEKYVRNSPNDQELDQVLKGSKISMLSDEQAVNDTGDQDIN